MKKKYYNDAFIGNKNIIASFSKYGELLRLYYPLPDYRQYSSFFHVGVKVNDSNIIYLHNDINNRYKQYYNNKSNVLNTEIENTYFNLNIKQTDCVMLNQDVLLRKYELKNENSIDLDIKFLVHSEVISSYNNMAGGMIENDALIQYSHNFTCAIFSKEKLYSHQLNNVERNINSGEIYDKDYIGMSKDSAISYNLGTLKPGEKREFTLIVFLKYDDGSISEVIEKIDKLRKINVDKEIDKVDNYWNKYLEEHNTLKLKKDGTEFGNKLVDIYYRTILFMPLLVNEKTGAIIASLEVDEERDKCGKYAYCWPRDAIMILNNLDHLGFSDLTEKFYSVFLKNTQCKNGMWEQRFFSDGRLAPCWGYQVDETAIVVWEAYEHYKFIEKSTGKKDKKFLKDNLKMLELATRFLEKYIDFILGKEEKEDLVRIELEKKYNYKERDEIYKHPSYDLWEQNEGVHLYSLSSIFGAFSSMIKIYDELAELFVNNRLKQDDIMSNKARYESYLREIKQYILENLVDKERQVLLRNKTDRLTDISMLGAVIPFDVFKPEEKIIKNTVEQINMTIRTYLGGYLRFQDDSYIGGKNPWIIATAWMGMYYKKIGDTAKANECLRFIVNSATPLGLLPEQANSDLNETWVIGLGWSHAMFIGMLLD